MDHIERTDGRVSYRIEGRGHEETLVLLHGLSADSGMFQPQIDFLRIAIRLLRLIYEEMGNQAS
ncbi:hypothetical protein SGODD07_00367 [Streptococcus gordonii]|uniref:Alpha/beta hydrolase n=1 Tax=Streptococcus gordonii TaxID=1302 RepID=A0A139NCB0_STRGN|nr:hypothetical protein SGODD07_00367 [Streptococcus gordonii]